MLIIIW